MVMGQSVKGRAMKSLVQGLSSLFLGMALIFFISPLLVYWFVHGDPERYLWIIRGPYPFSHLGSGPFQLAVGLLLIAAGVGSLILSRVFARMAR
ncbi:hypothetical protein JCM13210_15590 [Thermaerobacter litoralis]